MFPLKKITNFFSMIVTSTFQIASILKMFWFYLLMLVLFLHPE